jgi:NAD(P)-dependent dehydrogenase (short-subunit alcohol dehydrogenase family)
VPALMGGLGRIRNGSYAQLTVAPAANVAPIETSLSWANLAAIPESYATAWGTLHDNLALEPGQTLLVRGGTSALGQAAINVAHELGATVLATTRRIERLELLRSLGASQVVIDSGQVAEEIRARVPGGVDAVLDLVGNSVLRDSLRAARPRGRVCQAGFLGGLGPVDEFLPIADMPSGIQLSFFGSFDLGTAAYPLSLIPFQDIIAEDRGRHLQGEARSCARIRPDRGSPPPHGTRRRARETRRQRQRVSAQTSISAEDRAVANAAVRLTRRWRSRNSPMGWVAGRPWLAGGSAGVGRSRRALADFGHRSSRRSI